MGTSVVLETGGILCFLNNLPFGFWGFCTGSPRLIVTLEFKVAVAFLEGLQDQKFPGEVVTLIWGWGSGRNKLTNFYVRLLFKCIQEHTKQNKKNT